jgi:general secretion pathway protein A
MYLEHWGLNEMPFENTPDPRFLYYSAQHEEVLTRMLYVVMNKKGAGMLTGIFGCGKTLIGQSVLKELAKDRYKVALITNPRLEDIDLLRMIVYYLGVIEPPQRKSDVLILLNNILLNNVRDGKETVVIVDEAHCIDKDSIFEELRLLLNFQFTDRFLLTLLLFGQPELMQKVETNKQLSQRINIRSHLDSLDLKDTKSYIAHRLGIAGLSDRHIFDDDGIKIVYRHSGGIPRRINQICDMALFTGYCEGATEIKSNIIEAVVKDLEV